MAGMRILQALAAAGRARSAAVATGCRRCLLPRQALGAHQAPLGLGPRAVVWPSSLVPPPFSTNAGDGEGDGAAIAGGKGSSAIGGRCKIADVEATAQKTKAYAFHPLGIGNTARPTGEDMDIGAGTGDMKADQGPGKSISIGEMDIKVTSFGEEKGGEVVIGAGSGKEEKVGESEKGDELVGDVSSCLYDEARLRAYMEKLLVDKHVVDAPLFIENMMLERIKHSTESLNSETRHLMLMLVGIILKFIVVATVKYMQSAEKVKQYSIEKKRVEEVVTVDEEEMHEKIEKEEAVKEKEEDKQEEESSCGGCLILLVFLLFLI